MPAEPVELAVIVEGDRRKSLEAIRDRLVQELSPTEHVASCPCECGPLPASGRDVAAIVKELRATLAEIDAIPQRGKESTVDELARKRIDRRAQATAASGDGVRDKRR